MSRTSDNRCTPKYPVSSVNTRISEAATFENRLVPRGVRIFASNASGAPAADPGKISTCIQVGMRPETTLFALETMPGAHALACLAAAADVFEILHRDLAHARGDGIPDDGLATWAVALAVV